MSPVSVIESLRLWRAIIRSLPPLLPLHLERLDPEQLMELARNPGIDPRFLDRMARLHWKHAPLMRAILRHPRVPSETIRFLAQVNAGVLEGTLELAASGTALARAETAVPRPEPRQAKPLWQEIQEMNVAQRLQLALKAGKDARALLIRDPVKEVALAVLGNPRLGEDELERIARSKDVHEDVLREIGKKREWHKHYGVVAALVSNPRTPVSTSMHLMGMLQTRDILQLSKNRNVPEAVRVHARRLLEKRKS